MVHLCFKVIAENHELKRIWYIEYSFLKVNMDCNHGKITGLFSSGLY
jgi:hypothetical protein